MATAPVIDIEDADILERPRRAGREFVVAVLSEPEGRLGVALLVVLIGIIVAGPWIAPFDPQRIGVGTPLRGPSGSHWLGTDDFGRDILSRVLCGGRGVILVPFAGTAIAFALGAVIGIVAAYRRGALDAIVTRIVDVALSLPPLLIVLIVIAGVGGSGVVQVISLALVFTPRIVRVARGAAQAVVANEYIEIARTRGEGALAIGLREILPNITGRRSRSNSPFASRTRSCSSRR